MGGPVSNGPPGPRARIADLVGQPPPVDLPTQSYLERVAADDATAALFTRHAKGGDWLEWAKSLPAFRQLFRPTSMLDPAADDLARWFSDNFVATSPDQALATVQQFGGVLHPLTAHRAALALQRTPRADATVIGRWIPVLLTSAGTVGISALSMLLSGSRWPEDRDGAMLLLDHLLAPRQALTPRFAAADGRPVDSSIRELTGEDYHLRLAWEEFFRPRLDELAAPVAVMADRHLRTAHLVMRASGRASDRWDPMSFERSGIEPHPQDSPAQPFDLLIDIARDCLAALHKSAPGLAAATITSWAASTAPLLRRLAIFGYTYRTDVNADEKLRWAITEKLLYDATVKREVFVLLERALPGASAARKELLREIDKGPQDGEPGGGSEEAHDYAVYNLLTWVVSKAPDFAEARASLASLAARYPDFKPREHPDLDLVITGGATSPRSPVTASQVLQKTTPEDLDWMLEYQGEPQPGTWMDRFALLPVIGEAAATSPSWAIGIAGMLNDRQDWDTDLWPVIVEGWLRSAVTLEAREVADVVRQLERHQSLFGIIGSVTRLLQALAKRQDLAGEVLDQIEEYALKLWDIGTAAEAAATGTASVGPGTIAGKAAGHWAWELVDFWAQGASTRWRNDQDAWDGLPSRTRAALSGMLAGREFPSLAAATAIGANFAFLLSADEPWATRHILPAFDWGADAERAASTWAGHLAFGRWNDRVAALLQGYFEQCFSRIAAELRDVLAARVASMCLYGTANPLTSGLLPKYVSSVGEEERRKFASTVYEALRKEPVGSAEAQWDRWMRDYWLGRIASVPLPLAAREAGEMVNWVLTAGKYAPEAAELADRATAKISSSFLFFRRLKDSSIAKDTAPAARLVAHVLSGATDAAQACDDIGQVIYMLADRREVGTKQDLMDACSHAAAGGCANTLSWQAYVEGRFSS